MSPLTDSLSRRQVLAATAGAVIVGSTVAIAQPAKKKLEALISVAVIGTGARGSDHIRALQTIDEAHLVALADDYEPHLTKAAQIAGPGVKTFSDYRKMLDTVRPRAVIIAVPLHLHAAIASDVIATGCDVFLEKMMCYDLDSARKLAKQVETSHCIFQVGLQRRANAIYDQGLAMIQAGHIGRITAIKSQWHRNDSWRRPIPVPKTDARWAALDRRLNWRLYRDSSRGLLAELGSHQMDVANRVLGRPPKRAWATGGIDAWRDGREVFDNVFCVFEYEVNGALNQGKNASPRTVRVTYSALCDNAFEGASELIMGDKGTLLLTEQKGLLYREDVPQQIALPGAATRPEDAAQHEAALITAGKTLKMANDPWAHRGKPIEIDNEGGDATREELVSFLDHVRRRDPGTICDSNAGLVNAATILMAHEAAHSQKVVDFPADIPVHTI